MDFQDKNTLHKVRKTVLEMIADRGFIIPEVEDITFEQFTAKYNNKNVDIYINDETQNKKIYVHFHNETKNFSKKDLDNVMQKVITTYNDESIKLILIIKEKENSAVTKELSKETYKNVEVFLKKNMVFNVTHHVFVPKHVLLNKEEEDELLTKYNTVKSKLPKLSKSDPIAKYYGLKTDQVCKIIRKSPEVGESIYYRLVR